MSNTSQKVISTIIYSLFIVACIITITGVIWSILDIIMPLGKTALFLELNLGLQIAIVGAILAALLFLILMGYSLFKRGRRTIMDIIFKKKAIPDRYKNRTGIKVATGLVIVCLFAVIIGFIYALIVEVAFGKTSASSGLLLTFSGGEIVLFIGICLFLLDALFIFLILLWINGYYYILKLITNLEKQE